MILIEITERFLNHAIQQANTDMLIGRLKEDETVTERIKFYLQRNARVFAKYPDNAKAEFTIDGK
jgi:hypothetical protein